MLDKRAAEHKHCVDTGVTLIWHARSMAFMSLILDAKMKKN